MRNLEGSLQIPPSSLLPIAGKIMSSPLKFRRRRRHFFINTGLQAGGCPRTR
jgi:hypothetical protein